jgi:hypothetical protein
MNHHAVPAAIAACSFFASAAASAQQERWSFQGETRRETFGASVGWLSDLDGDGVRDFALGSAPAGGTWVPTAGTVHLCSGVDGATLREWSHAGLIEFGKLVVDGGDLDGDGFDDLLVGSLAEVPNNESAVFAFSAASGALLFDVRGVAGSGDRLGASLAAMGDLDGDGVPDFAVGIPSYVGSGVKGRVEFRSGANRSVLGTVTGTSDQTRFGDSNRIAPMGDLDGDGVIDLLTAELTKPASSTAPNCKVDVWSGATRLSLLHVKLLVSQWTNGHQLCVAAAGDVDGDGMPDALVSVPLSKPGNRAGRALVVSGATGATLHTFLAPAGGDLGRLCFGAGDVNSDGHADVGVTSIDAAGVESLSLRSGLDGSELLALADDAPGQQLFAQSLAAGADVDGDGISELLIGSLPGTTGYHAAGGVQCRSLADDSTLFALEGIAHDSHWRSDVAFVADQDGDGLPELVATDSTGEFANVAAARDLVLLSGNDGSELRRQALTHALMGHFVALPDVSGDGVSDFAAAGVAPWAEDLGSGAPPFDEVVEIRSGADLSLLRTITATVGDVHFGASLAVGVQPGGAVEIAIGSPRRDLFALNDLMGRIDVHDAATGQRRFSVDGTSLQEYFGSSLAFAGDVNGDGVGDWAVGGPQYGTVFGYKTGEGRVVLLSGVDGALLHAWNGVNQADEFGRTVVAIGDQDGDGLPELAISSELITSYYKGRVELFASTTRAIYATIDGSVDYEQYGRSLVADPPRDGDGGGDFVVGVWDPAASGAARLELRSGRDGTLLRSLRAGGDAFHDSWWLGAAPPSWLPSAPPKADGPWLASVDVADSLAGPRTGRVALLELDDLYLELDPPSVAAGATVAAATRGGPPAALAALFLAAINGAPVGAFLAFGALDASGEFAVSDTVPPGLAGQEWELRGYAIGWNGKLVDSQTETLRFQ